MVAGLSTVQLADGTIVWLDGGPVRFVPVPRSAATAAPVVREALMRRFTAAESSSTRSAMTGDRLRQEYCVTSCRSGSVESTSSTTSSSTRSIRNIRVSSARWHQPSRYQRPSSPTMPGKGAMRSSAKRAALDGLLPDGREGKIVVRKKYAKGGVETGKTYIITYSDAFTTIKDRIIQEKEDNTTWELQHGDWADHYRRPVHDPDN